MTQIDGMVRRVLPQDVQRRLNGKAQSLVLALGVANEPLVLA